MWNKQCHIYLLLLTCRGALLQEEPGPSPQLRPQEEVEGEEEEAVAWAGLAEVEGLEEEEVGDEAEDEEEPLHLTPPTLARATHPLSGEP